MREHADAGRIGEREHARSFVDREQIDAVNPEIALQLQQKRVLLAQNLHDFLVAERFVQPPQRVVQPHRVDHEVPRPRGDLPCTSPRGLPKSRR